MNMRVMISGGGTGGHIYPALAIARKIIEKHPAASILFVGTQTGLESDIIPKEGFLFSAIDVQGFSRSQPWKNIRIAWKAGTSLIAAKRLIQEFSPDVVVGTGGYVCGPVLLMASWMNIPTIIQEQNAVAGITNRWLSRVVSRIAVGYEEAVRAFSRNKDKVIVTGNPVRKEILAVSRESGRKILGLDQRKLVLLVVGGSRGARSINQAMIDVHKWFFLNSDVQILHITGKNEYNGIVDALKEEQVEIGENIRIEPYLYDMPSALAAADIAVSRAGALSLAELSLRGIPSVLIPYPYAAGNHQEHNAQVMKNNGAAFMIHDDELKGTILLDAIKTLLDDHEKRQEMMEANLRLAKPNAADDIVKIIEDMLSKRCI